MFNVVVFHDLTDASVRKEASARALANEKKEIAKSQASASHVELFVPGSVYYLQRNTTDGDRKGKSFFTLWRRHPGDHLQRIVLSNNLFSDHKCDSHYHALRDVLKGLPLPSPGHLDALFGDVDE